MSAFSQWLLFAQLFHIGVGDNGPRLNRGNLTVRYSMLLPGGDFKYLESKGLPLLKNSVCLMEKNFAPAWQRNFGQLPQYVIYVDNHTHKQFDSWFSGALRTRMRLVNLDLDPLNLARMAQVSMRQLNSENEANVRKSLADSDHLPSFGSRLLLGSDVSVLKNPTEFLTAVLRLQPKQAVYVADKSTFGGGLYKLTNWEAPQCAGLMADFIYMSEGLKTDSKSLLYKMMWYMLQPVSENRHAPPCAACVQASNGLHAVDQFAMALALGEAAQPQGSCFPLGSKNSFLDGSPDTEIRLFKELDNTCVLD